MLMQVKRTFFLLIAVVGLPLYSLSVQAKPSCSSKSTAMHQCAIKRCDPELSDRLYAAIESHDETQVEKTIQLGADPNTFCGEKGKYFTPLQLSVFGRNISVMSALLKAGADPNKANKYGGHPIESAISGNIDALKLLLAYGADPNTKDSSPEHWSLLGEVAACTHEENVCEKTMKILLEAGANPNAINASGDTPIFNAIAFYNFGIVNILMHFGAKLNFKDVSGKTPLLSAVESYWLAVISNNRRYKSEQIKIINFLLQNGANGNIKDPGSFDDYLDKTRTPYMNGYTLLGLAARHGWYQLAKLLLAHGANPLIPRSDGALPEKIANDHRHSQTATLIGRYLARGHYKRP